jgi:hypothetical protein
LNWVLNSGRKDRFLNLIDDEILRDFLRCALQSNQDERSDLKTLIQHPFFDPVNTQNEGLEVKLNGNFDDMIEEKLSAKEDMK